MKGLNNLDCLIVGVSRTPIGSFGGMFKNVPAVTLGSHAIENALKKAKVDPNEVDEVYFGNVLQANLGQNPGKQAALKAGVPNTVPATTVNKVCASGLKAVILGAMQIQLGISDVIVAGGMENMSQAPFLNPKMRFGNKFGGTMLEDCMQRDGLSDPDSKEPMGAFAEHCNAKYKVSREDQDAYALRSYTNSIQASNDGKLDKEIDPVTIKVRGKEIILNKDEEPFLRPTTKESLEKLRPAFNQFGDTVTAGNASTINDGASSVVLMSYKKFKELGSTATPLAVIRGYADAAIAPNEFPVAPTKAIPLALERANLSTNEIDYFEINEAFSSVPIHCSRMLDIPMEKINVFGSGVSTGHAIGNSGSKILVTLTSILNDKESKYGVAAICNGLGGASSVVIERYQA